MLNQMGKDTLIPNESFEIYLNFTALKEKENATNNVLINATCSGEEGSESCSEYETSFFDIFSEVPKKPGFTFQINITNAPQNFSFQIDDPNDIFIEWGDDFHELIEENSTFVIHEYTENSVYNVSLSGNASRIAFYKEEDGENVASSDLIIDVLTPVYNAS